MGHDAKMVPSRSNTEYCTMPLSTPSPLSDPEGAELPRCIGLTGGIGSGKSTVAKVLRVLGFSVYDADAAAKSLYDRHPTLMDEVVRCFGDGVLHEDGTLNRQALADRVFADAEALSRLNGLVHPVVREDFEEWRRKQGGSGASVVFREAAILFESGSHVDCDAVWAVAAPEAVRMARVLKRSDWTEAEIQQRMDRQWPAERVQGMADRVLDNSGSKPLVPQVLEAVISLAETGNA